MSVCSLSKYKRCINKLQQQQRKPPLSHLCSPPSLLRLYPPLSGDALPWAKRPHFPWGITSNLTCPYRFHIQRFSSALEGTSFLTLRSHKVWFSSTSSQSVLKCLSFLCFPSCLCFYLPQNDWIAFFFSIQPAITLKKKKKKKGMRCCWHLGSRETEQNPNSAAQIFHVWVFSLCFCGEKSLFSVHRSSAWLSFFVN